MSRGSILLRKPQIHVPHTRIRLVQEQYPIARRLLDHLRMHIVTLGELLLVLRIFVGDQAREVGLLVRSLASELVKGEGGGDGGQGDVEAALIERRVVS